MRVHRNNIGVLRLLFAAMVIVGHTPELLDGNRSREPLTMLLGGPSLGEVAVAGFFILSGYLITGSMLKTRSLPRYFERRILRIYPAFVVAYLLSALAMGPLLGAPPRGVGHTILYMLALQPPTVEPGQLGWLPYPLLNGSMWTIAYEFRCYVLVALLFAIGLLRRGPILVLWIAFVTMSPFETAIGARLMWPNHSALFLLAGLPSVGIHLVALFLSGMVFSLFEQRIAPHLTARNALIAASATVALVFHDAPMQTAVFCTVGAFALFWASFEARLGSVQRINDRSDISYGVYLYGWPVTTCLITFAAGAWGPWPIACAALAISALLGVLSWFGIERWTKGMRILPQDRQAAPA